MIPGTKVKPRSRQYGLSPEATYIIDRVDILGNVFLPGEIRPYPKDHFVTEKTTLCAPSSAEVDAVLEKIKDWDTVENPSHYEEGRKYSPLEVVLDWGLGFCLGNVVKYISRSGRKTNELEDLKKARFYLEKKIEKLEQKND